MSTNDTDQTVTEYGVQSDGTFRKKSIDQIRAEMKSTFEQTLGQDIELRPSSPITQIIDAVAVEIATQWDAAEAAYYASFYQDAFGEQLDKQLALAGFSRDQLRGATGVVEFSRDSPAPRDIDIPEGTVVTTRRTDQRPAIPFQTTESVTLFTDQTTVTASIEALNPWQTSLDKEWLGEETNVSANTIVRFDAPVSGIDSVTNPLPTGDPDEGFVVGRDEESDAEFKLRYQNTLAEGGVSTVPAMESSIIRWDDRIISVRVEEIRDADDGYGPEVTVFAPELFDDSADANDIVAQAIFESRGAGLESFGAETGTAESEDGRTRTERFEKATEVTIAVDANLTTSSSFPDDGDIRITDNIIRFIGGEDSTGLTSPGLDIGEDVIYDQVKNRVMEIRGVIQADVDIGVSESELARDNVSIDTLEVAMTDEAEVTISE